MEPTYLSPGIEFSRYDPFQEAKRVKFYWGNDICEICVPLPLGDFEWWSYSLGEVYLTLPLWFVSALCVAWPVTSFMVARRRRGRGFEVEAKPAGSTPLLPGEVDAERSGADGEGGNHAAMG